MDEQVFPAEPVYAEQRQRCARRDGRTRCRQSSRSSRPAARSRGLWNLFLPEVVRTLAARLRAAGRADRLVARARTRGDELRGAGHRQHGGAAPGRHRRAEAAVAGAVARRRDPVGLRDDRARRRVLGRDATSRTSIVRDGDDYVINGRKWWTTGAADPRCAVLIVMGRTDPDADAHRQQSMVLVPMDTPGVELVRSLPVFGYDDQHGHGEIVLRRRARAGVEPARQRRRRVRHRPGPARTGTRAPLHAADRHGRARAVS